MSIIDSEEEIDYNEQDIDNMCQVKEDLDIGALLDEKKEDETSIQISSDIITDIDLGQDILSKYQIALDSKTPIEFIFSDSEGNYFSIFNSLRGEKEIINIFDNYNKEYNININNFVFAYFLANYEQSKNFTIERLNLLKDISYLELDKDNYEDKKREFLLKLEFLNKKTFKKYDEVQKFYKDLTKLSYSTSPSKINNSIKIKESRVIFKVSDDDYEFSIDDGPIIFNNMTVNEIFPFIQYHGDEDKFYKIYQYINEEELIKSQVQINKIIEMDERKNEDYIFVVMKIYLLNKVKYILLEFDLKEGILDLKYPGNSLNIIKKDLPQLLENIKLSKEKIIRIKGSFELIFPNYDNTRLYFLTFFDKIINNFLYVKEYNKPRSLLSDSDKFYFKTYNEDESFSDYSASFFIEPLYSDIYSINFSSKIINSKSINEFALIMSKLAWYYNNTDDSLKDEYELVVVPYTGPEGGGLGAPISEKISKLVTFKSKKIDNLFEKAPEIFPRNEYSRLCGCPKQPIIIEDEDVEDWQNYRYQEKKHEVITFPPLNYDQEGKKYNFVCPTENNVMSFIPNPDYTSDYPILPCCTSQKKSGLYEKYAEIKNKGSIFFSEKEEKRATQIKTIKILNYNQLGFLPDNIQELLQTVHPNNKFFRYGVAKNNPFNFLIAILIASDHLSKLKVGNEQEKNRLNTLIKLRDNFMKTTEDVKKNAVVRKLKENLTKFAHINCVKQENFGLNNNQIIEKLKNNFDSYYFYKLMENIFHVNIFIFVYQDDQITIERPNHRFFHHREININLPSILLFKHITRRGFPVCELIRSDTDIKGSSFPFLYTNVITRLMKRNIEKYPYYICESHKDKEYTVRRNYYQNINWNYILADYPLVGQSINDSGRAYRINIMVDNEEISLYIPPSFPLNLPTSETIATSTSEKIKDLFDGESLTGSRGLWFNMNGCLKSVFVPCSDISKNELVCNSYEIEKKQSEIIKNFIQLNVISRNANIIKQLILWCWNLSNIEQVDAWFQKYVIKNKNKEDYQMFSQIPININYRFPRDIDTVDAAINYLSYFIPIVFRQKHIYLYDELYEAFKQFLENYKVATQGLPKVANQAIIKAFTNEEDFIARKDTRIIIGEKNWQEWVNFISVGNKLNIEIDEEDSLKIRPFLYKDKEGHIYLIQNTIEANLGIILLLCKVWKDRKINLGYYTTNTNIWSCLEKDIRIMEVAGLDKKSIITKANQLSDSLIDNFCEAIQFLDKENIVYEDKKDCHYMIYHRDGSVEQKGNYEDEEQKVWVYDNGRYAAMLPII